MSGFGASPKDSGGIPISSVYVPNVGFIALQGSASSNTDSSSNQSTAALLALGASNSASGTLQNAQTGNAAGTPLPVLGYASVAFTVNMVGFTGTVTFKGSEDGTNYDPINVAQAGTGTITTTAVGSTTTSIHVYEGSCAGLQSVEAVTSGVSAGNVTVTAHAIPINIAPRTINVANIAQIGGVAPQMASGDGVTSSNILEFAPGFYNGTTIDRQRGNLDNITLINASAVSATQTSTDQINYNARGVKVYLNVGTIGTGSLVLTISAKDPVSSQYFTLLTGAAVTTATSAVYTIYPGITTTANVAVSDVLPRTWRVQVTGANGTTFTVASSTIL